MARRGSWRRRIVLLLTAALAAAGAGTAAVFLQRSETLITEGCTAVAGGLSAELATDQAANAALITAVAVRRELPARAASIALATALQESKLRNISYGDQAGPDSRGLFQQRPSQGWGSTAQVMDPYYASNAFFDALVEVPGYESLEITVAAQEVQRSAYPAAYARHEATGRAFASALSGETAAGLDCSLRTADAAGDPGAVGTKLTAALGDLPLTADGRSLLVDAQGNLAWAVAQWAVANAKALSITGVEVDGRRWNRDARTGWEPAPGPADQVRITVSDATAG
ncbi:MULTISPECIES: hypothetical protein [Arthrobacter]|uniref:Heavy metal transporter n=1 Tax=Arthrobacter oryzae TaxID=409290 RepID=A0A3N0BW88_9MICC|nr:MULTISPECIES: hypothetical protein [Arthrobacter]QYF89611.1 hypothetical protein KY499_16380 [Arthrobacter sp. PAMC25284]RNL53286.1 hypothetical protein D7003_12325 [Arthrobacter oryzae]